MITNSSGYSIVRTQQEGQSLPAALFGSFQVVSLESLQVILRDERDLLLPTEQRPDDLNNTMFPNGFSAERFVEIVETGEVWKSLD